MWKCIYHYYFKTFFKHMHPRKCLNLLSPILHFYNIQYSWLGFKLVIFVNHTSLEIAYEHLCVRNLLRNDYCTNFTVQTAGYIWSKQKILSQLLWLDLLLFGIHFSIHFLSTCCFGPDKGCYAYFGLWGSGVGGLWDWSS